MNESHQLSKQAAYSRRQTQAAAEIGDIPKVSEEGLLKACVPDLHLFLSRVFPYSTGLKPFSEDQKTAIKNLETAILVGGRFAQALPRGFAKTSIASRAALWSVLNAHRKYVVIYCSNAGAAEKLVEGMKQELENNPLLLAMFPSSVFPIRCLDGKPQGTTSQTYRGELTKQKWRAHQIVLPTIPGCLASGSVIEAKAVNASRGSQHTTPAGVVLRPDFIILDDPQTDEDALNPSTVAKIVRKIKRSVLRSGGHSASTACVANVTVIEEDDVAESFLNDPSWMAVRFKMMQSMPINLEKHWLGTYREIRQNFDKSDSGSRRRALQSSLEYYIENRKDMDEGAKASWEWCYNYEDESSFEISAIQHAMNILVDDGPDVFFHECQNEIHRENADLESLNWKDVVAKSTSCARRVAPSGSVLVTGQIDVHDKILSWGLCAWQPTFGGAVIDYGTWPEQTSRNFVFKKARRTLQKVASRGSDLEGSVYEGLMNLISEMVSNPIETEDGQQLFIDRILIDAGYLPGAVHRVCRDHPNGSQLAPAKGRGVKASDRPITEWRKTAGAIRGEEWIYQRPAKGTIRQVIFDTNHWKTKIHEQLQMPVGNRHSLNLYEGTASHHRMFAEHVTAEKKKVIKDEKQGRTVNEWYVPPNHPDNHWFDFLVGSAVAASMQGLTRFDHGRMKQRRKKSRRIGELQI